MATYNKNEMLPQRKEALEKWSSYIESLPNSGSFATCIYKQNYNSHNASH